MKYLKNFLKYTDYQAFITDGGGKFQGINTKNKSIKIPVIKLC